MEIIQISKLVRSVNAGVGLTTYNIVVIMPPEGVTSAMEEDFETQLLYHHDTSVLKNGTLN
jgi:hypothetical protein